MGRGVVNSGQGSCAGDPELGNRRWARFAISFDD